LSGRDLTSKRLIEGDILLEASGGGPGKPVGRVALFKDPRDRTYACSNFFRTLRPNQLVDAAFLSWYLRWSYRQPLIWRFQQQTTGITNLKHHEYLRQTVPLPPRGEQHRIVKILDTADDATRSAERLVDKLRCVHEGLADDLFTGRKLFEEGPRKYRREIAPSEWTYGRLPGATHLPVGWQIVTLTDVARLETGHTPERDVPSYWNGAIPWLSLHDTSRLEQRELAVTALSITEAGIRNSSARLLPAGTVALSRTATVGKCVILGREMATSQDFACYVCGPAVEPWYLMQLFRHMQPVWRRLAGGSTHQTVYMPVFERLQVLLPPISVQRDIAEALEASELQADAAIAGLSKLRALRSGLTEDLITGTVRVDVDDDAA
jgi:type I restriction enzyme S subunit